MNDLNKERLFDVAQQLDREHVDDIEEYESALGCEIYAQELTPQQQKELTSDTVRTFKDGSVEQELDTSPVEWVIMGAVDEDGNKLFDLKEEPKLKKCGNSLIMPIFNKIQELSDVNEEEIEEAGRQ